MSTPQSTDPLRCCDVPSEAACRTWACVPGVEIKSGREAQLRYPNRSATMPCPSGDGAFPIVADGGCGAVRKSGCSTAAVAGAVAGTVAHGAREMSCRGDTGPAACDVGIRGGCEVRVCTAGERVNRGSDNVVCTKAAPTAQAGTAACAVRGHDGSEALGCIWGVPNIKDDPAASAVRGRDGNEMRGCITSEHSEHDATAACGIEHRDGRKARGGDPGDAAACAVGAAPSAQADTSGCSFRVPHGSCETGDCSPDEPRGCPNARGEE